ncbi:hypothetical protein [Streptomyces sp. NBC_01800]|uniref:hypothetical protein n=1 Tax=Streptomyces sp. NBC_01800 TaxID=2975945 RepID=UPI003FA367D1
MVGVHRAQSPAAAVAEPTTSDPLGAGNAATDAVPDAVLEALPPSAEQAAASPVGHGPSRAVALGKSGGEVACWRCPRWTPLHTTDVRALI